MPKAWLLFAEGPRTAAGGVTGSSGGRHGGTTGAGVGAGRGLLRGAASVDGGRTAAVGAHVARSAGRSGWGRLARQAHTVLRNTPLRRSQIAIAMNHFRISLQCF